MKKNIILVILIIDIVLFGISSLIYSDSNKSNISSSEIGEETTISELSNYKNIYAKDISFNFVKNTNISTLRNKQDLYNVLFTMLNNGYDFYDIKCDKNYQSCVQDLLHTLNNRETLNVINNLVNPYNSINLNTRISYLPSGEMRLYVDKKYSNDEIYFVENKINAVINMLVNDKMSNKEKVKRVHDYLANTISYGNINKADNAYGALINGVAICSGYADAFSLFMDKLNIPNYKVVSKTHVWNVVYIDGEWKHIDLTYDDPKNTFETNAINYDYFLINTNKLRNNDLTEHNFDLNIYSELI